MPPLLSSLTPERPHVPEHFALPCLDVQTLQSLEVISVFIFPLRSLKARNGILFAGTWLYGLGQIT